MPTEPIRNAAGAPMAAAAVEPPAGSAVSAGSPRPLYGIAMMLCACALIAVTTLIAKALGQGVGAGGPGAGLHPLQVSAGRFLFAWLTLVPLVIWFRPTFRGARLPVHLARVVCGWAGVTCLFAAAAVMRLADATAISFLNPIVAMLLAIPLLSEKVGPWRWTAAAIAFAGALVLINPGTGTFQPMVIVAFGSALFLGLEAIIIKILAGGEPPLRILAINNTLGMIIALGAAAAVWVAPTPTQWLMMAGLGMVMLSAQACFLQAMRNGDASLVMPVFYATLIFAALYDFVAFGEVPTAASAVGSLMILSGGALLAWREGRRRKS